MRRVTESKLEKNKKEQKDHSDAALQVAQCCSKSSKIVAGCHD